jgi:hypothetical protein
VQSGARRQISVKRLLTRRCTGRQFRYAPLPPVSLALCVQVTNQRKLQKSMKSFGKFLFFIVGLYVVTDLSYRYINTGTFSGKGFSAAETERIQDDIKSQYESKEGNKVLKIALAKVSPMKLEGFVQIQPKKGAAYTQECEALKGENLRITWRCRSEG